VVKLTNDVVVSLIGLQQWPIDQIWLGGGS